MDHINIVTGRGSVRDTLSCKARSQTLGSNFRTYAYEKIKELALETARAGEGDDRFMD